jgi:serine/threonine protein kinase
VTAKSQKAIAVRTAVATALGSRYEILENIGAGAVAEVYRAHDTALDRMVAIKYISLETFAYPGQMDNLKERFLREGRVAAGLHHNNIVTTYDIISTDDANLLVMEFVKGVTLQSVLASKKLTLKETLQVLSQVAAALDYAHERKVIHRDVKPANILVASSGEVKVADFGIAKAESSKELTVQGGVLGTPEYMSPEQAMGRDLDGRSDLFSLGCVLYECLTGEKAFQASTLTAILLKIVNEEPAPIDLKQCGLPAQVRDVLNRALAKNPADRFASGAELIDALRSLSADDLEDLADLPRVFPDSPESVREFENALRSVEDSVADTLMKEARRKTQIEPHLKALYRDDRRLRVVTSPLLSFQNVELTPEEGFILSRIDGTLTPSDIFRLSHLSENDTARTLLGLLRAGIVELESEKAGREAAAMAKSTQSEKPARPAQDEPSADKQRQEIERVFVELQKQNDWEALGLVPGADSQTMKKAFREKTFRYHPDRHHRISDLVLEKKLSFIVTRLNEAFANLSNEADRVTAKPVSGTAGSPTTQPAAHSEQDRARALYLQAKRAYDRMDYWETIQFCREAVELVNDRAEYFYLLAQALARNANWRKEAAENLRNATRLEPMNVEYLLALGEIYRREGLEVRARKTFEQAKSIDPSCKIPEQA